MDTLTASEQRRPATPCEPAQRMTDGEIRRLIRPSADRVPVFDY